MSKRLGGSLPSVAILLWCIFFSHGLIGQNISFGSTSSDLVVCGLGDTFTVDMTNLGADTLFNLQIEMDLHPGLQYMVGSVNGGGVTESALPLPDSIILAKDTLLPFSNASFLIVASASCAATDSGVVRNEILVTHSMGVDSAYLAPFAILRPALSIQSVTPSSVTDTVGATFTRCVTLINGGFGELRDFFLAIQADTSLLAYSNIRLVPSNTPVPFSYSGDSIVMKLDFPFISQVGDGDGLFEQNETMEICYDVTIRTCDGGQSAIHAYWGCGLDLCESQTQTANAIVDDITPILTMSRIFQTNTCYGDSTSLGKIIVTNTGAGRARDVTVDVWIGNSNGATSSYIAAIDTSTLLWKNANGTVTQVSPAYVENGSAAGQKICLGPNPIRRARVLIPFMEPGEQDTLVFEMIDCCKTWCGNFDYVTGRSHYEVKYRSVCDTTTYYLGPALMKTWNFARSISLAVTGPTDINPGDTATYCIEHSDFRFYDLGPGAHSIADIILPPSLSYTGLAGDFYYEDPQGDLWNPTSVTVIGDTIRGTFNLPQPAGVTREKIKLKIRVIPDCSGPCDGGQTAIQYNLYQRPDTNCACVATVICYSFNVNVHCGICNCTDGGLIFTDFRAQRANYGLPDNDNDGNIDAIGALDSTQVRMNYIMFGDTLRTRFSGRVDTTTPNPFWTHGYASSTITRGQRLTPLSAAIHIYDQSAAATYYCVLAAPQVNVVAGETREYIYRFDTTSLAACLPAGFVFDEGDSIDVTANYRVSSNIGGAVQSQTITNEFALHNPGTTGDTASCDTYSGAFVLVGYYYTNCCYGKYNATACNQVTISQNYYLSIGNCCANYSGGNLFEYEFRHWAIMDKAYVVVPNGYNFISATHRNWRTAGTGASSATPTMNIPLGGTSGDTLIFDLDSTFTSYGGTVPLSDDGFFGQLQVTLEPTCEVNQDAERVYYIFDAEPVPALTGSGSYPIRRISYDSLAYQGANLVIAPAIPVVPGIQGTVTWDFLIENLANVHDAANTWFAFFSPSGQIVPVTVRDLSTNTVINPVNGIYQIGVLPGDSIQGYSVTADYNTCNFDSLQILTGWNCPSYPSNLANAACIAASAYLYVDPQPADLQANLNISPNPVDICDSVLVELNVVSSQIGYISDISVNTVLPLVGLTFQSGSGEFRYPNTNAFVPIPDPTQVGNVLTWDINSLSAIIAANDLAGTTRPDSNAFSIRFYLETDCDFISGRQFLVRVEGDRACGDPLPPILLISPPIDINGATQPYTTIVSGQSTENSSCPMNQTMEVVIVKSGSGPTTPSDSIQVELNPGYSYAGGFVGVQNSPSVTNPSQTSQAGGTILRWELPPGLSAGDSVIFRFDVDIFAQVGCGNDFATVSTLVNSTLFCARTGMNCATSAVTTGTSLLNIAISRPDLSFTAFTSTRAQVTGGWEYVYNGTIANNGTAISAGTNTTVNFYCDTDNSGGYSAGDALLGNYNTTAAIPNGGTHSFGGLINYTNASCADSNDIFAVIFPDTANNYCLCDTAEANTNTVLPVAWLELGGEAEPDGNRLNWEAVMLPGHDHFRIQHLEDGNWKSISTAIRGTGSKFEWMHRFPEEVETYRVQAMDQNGGRSYSETLRLERGEGELCTVHPNPARHEVFLNGPQGAHFQITNVLGVMVEEGYLDGTEIRRDVGLLPSGVYFAEFEFEGQGQVLKLVLE